MDYRLWQITRVSTVPTITLPVRRWESRSLDRLPRYLAKQLERGIDSLLVVLTYPMLEEPPIR